jgi:HEAT repeats
MIKYLPILLVVLVFASGCTRWYERYGIPDKNQLLVADSIPNLFNALDDPDSDVRMLAIKFLGRFWHLKIISRLEIVALNDPDKNVRNLAVSTISSLKKKRGSFEEETIKTQQVLDTKSDSMGSAEKTPTPTKTGECECWYQEGEEPPKSCNDSRCTPIKN